MGRYVGKGGHQVVLQVACDSAGRPEVTPALREEFREGSNRYCRTPPAHWQFAAKEPEAPLVGSTVRVALVFGIERGVVSDKELSCLNAGTGAPPTPGRAWYLQAVAPEGAPPTFRLRERTRLRPPSCTGRCCGKVGGNQDARWQTRRKVINKK